MRKMIVILFAAALLLLISNGAWAQGEPCSQCGPGPHWIDDCTAGQDLVADHGALLGIDFDLDCEEDVRYGFIPCNAPDNLLVVNRSGPLDDSQNFPGLRPVDGHLDVIDTEIISMCLNYGNLTLIAGAGLGQGGVLAPSLGAIAEKSDNNMMGESFFDVFFEVDKGDGTFLYNQTPLRIEVDITCVPPQARYISTECLPLYDDPTPGQGTHVANLVGESHVVNTPPIPTLTNWGLIVLLALLVLAGIIVIRQRRKVSVPA